METTKCNCGKASINYDVIAKDKWIGKALNTDIINVTSKCFCVCKDCRTIYDTFDPFMVTII